MKQRSSSTNGLKPYNFHQHHQLQSRFFSSAYKGVGQFADGPDEDKYQRLLWQIHDDFVAQQSKPLKNLDLVAPLDSHYLEPEHKTPNWLYWQHTDFNSPINSAGKSVVFHADKEHLLARLAELHRKGDIGLSGNVSIINEGCDNADFAALLLPYLRSVKEVGEINILLTNGNVAKMRSAVNYCGYFVGTENVSWSLEDAFARRPEGLEDSTTSRRIFLPFRLPAAESPQRVEKYIIDRTALLRYGDLMAACFMRRDELSDKLFRYTYRWEGQPDEGDGITVFRRRLLASKRQKVRLNSEAEVPADHVFAALYTPDAMMDLLQVKAGAKVLHASSVPVKTEFDGRINMLTAIWAKGDVRLFT